MSKYKYYVAELELTGQIVVMRKGKFFVKTMATFRNNPDGWDLAAKYCRHLNIWFDNGNWQENFK